MPELPEVEFGRKVAERVALGRVIQKVWVDDDPIVFDGVSKAKLTRTLRGRTVVAVHRRGKQLWFELDQAPHPLFHFGMTGSFRTKRTTPLVLASSPKKPARAAWPPRFTKIRLWLGDEMDELVMTNARRLGRIRLRQDPLGEPPLSKLGFDPLIDMPRLTEFKPLVCRRKVAIKALLLNQSFAAGVGNWIADEVLYQARIDPRRRANTLDDAELKALHSKIKSVVKTAVGVDARNDKLPKKWLMHRRWGKQADATTHDGKKIEFVTVGGRTSAWVPDVQK